MSRKTYRDYLKLNGIPLKYDFKKESDIQASRDATCLYYEDLYKDINFSLADNILEVGAHYGAFAQFLNTKGIIPDAIDLDNKKIEYLNSVTQIKANFIAGDANEKLKDKKKHYDAIFMNFVLEHVWQQDLLELLRTLQKSLKVGGKIYVLVPNMENPYNLRLRYMEPTHYNGFTTETLIWALYMGGFDEITCKDAKIYSADKLKKIEEYFSSMAELFEIRKFHGKYSESLMGIATKCFSLEEIEFGPYDF